VRITNAIFPHTFVIPLSETLTITQMHVPVDDTHTYWFSFFTSFAEPLDKRNHAPAAPGPRHAARLRAQDQGRHNDWGFSAEEQRTRTYLGMGEDDINVHDQWAVESMGAIQDRTREHLGKSDKVIMANRRTLLQAIETVRRRRHVRPWLLTADAGCATMRGPDTIDCIAPARAGRRTGSRRALPSALRALAGEDAWPPVPT
jgi:phthalate 4,5-dioxygenase oxygenase subunit